MGETAQKEGATGHNIIYIDYADANGNIGKVKRWHLDKDNNLTAVSQAAGGVYAPKANQQNNPSVQNLSKSEQDLLNYQWDLVDVTTLKLAERASIMRSEQTVENQLATEAAANTDADTNINTNINTNAGNAPVSVNQSRNIVLDNEPLVAKQTQAEDVISLPISPNSVYLLTRRAEDLSLTQLYDHKQFNASQGTRSLEHEVAFWQKLLSPFAILSLVIVACSFVFGSLRTHSLGLRIVVALIFGLLFSYIQDLTSFVSLATGASPLLMVLLPIIASALLGFYLIKRQS